MKTVAQKPEPLPALVSSDLLGWLGGKLAEAEKTLKSREQMAATCRTGTNAEWNAASKMHPSTVGMKSTKAERLKEAQMHDRIADRLRHDRDMFRTTINLLS